MMLPFISVIAVVRNEESHVEDLIKSLLDLDYPKESYEITIVDGMSTDRTQELVKKYPVKLLLNEKIDRSNGRNLGIAKASGEYIAFTDGDCVVDKNWLKTVAQEIEKAPEGVVAVGGPNLIFEDDPAFAKVVGYIQETFLGSGGSAQSFRHRDKKFVRSIPNCNILYRKEGVLSVGGYDTGFNVGEDGELNFRLKDAGYNFLYLPDAIVWHRRRAGLKRFLMNMFLYGEAMAKITKKHGKIVRWYSFLPSLALILILIFPFVSTFPQLVWIYMLAGAVYAAAISISTVQTLLKSRSLYSLLSPVLITLQILSYGFGFIYGMIKPWRG